MEDAVFSIYKLPARCSYAGVHTSIDINPAAVYVGAVYITIPRNRNLLKPNNRSQKTVLVLRNVLKNIPPQLINTGSN